MDFEFAFVFGDEYVCVMMVLMMRNQCTFFGGKKVSLFSPYLTLPYL